MIITYGVGILLSLIVIGIPIGFALGLAGTFSLLMVSNVDTVNGLLGQVVHETAANYVLLTIPMFVLMSELLGAGGLAQDLMIACNRLLRRIRGGLAMACVMAGAILAAASGSSTASVATISSAAFPTMKALGYDRGFAIGTISIAGTLAIMIPPSIAFVVYGIITEESIGRLFMAGLVPGLLTAAGYIITIAFMVWRKPELAPGVGRPNSGAGAVTEELRQSGNVWPIVGLVILILGALYAGVATPTEVGAIGALGALLLSVMMRRLTGPSLVQAVGNTVRTTAMIVTIIFGALLFGYFISYTQTTTTLLVWIRDSGLSPHAVLLLILAVYLVLGMLMDQFAIIVLTVPITYALMTGLGFDGIWFGVLIVKTAEIGLVTPPMGLNIFISSAATGVTTREGFAGVTPFVVTELIILALLVAFPEITLFLPDLLG
ncbi:TRAP transporter large permease (plasmid) [Skermanella mucosa]|uniref:TRAP transporter large permease n=1 Tax=Skermanella mucosa TaxID=1789672 RepID=UPI00192ADA3E|nr:TRAP transporter large permease [Skermanella mucosa]UEM24492.1 TRAP transporter large permease [Skermanella mucosa]